MSRMLKLYCNGERKWFLKTTVLIYVVQKEFPFPHPHFSSSLSLGFFKNTHTNKHAHMHVGAL